jgi:hypothetical protein
MEEKKVNIALKNQYIFMKPGIQLHVVEIHPFMLKNLG